MSNEKGRWTHIIFTDRDMSSQDMAEIIQKEIYHASEKPWDLPYTSEAELKNALGDEYEAFKKQKAYQNRPWASNKKDERYIIAHNLKYGPGSDREK